MISDDWNHKPFRQIGGAREPSTRLIGNWQCARIWTQVGGRLANLCHGASLHSWQAADLMYAYGLGRMASRLSTSIQSDFKKRSKSAFGRSWRPCRVVTPDRAGYSLPGVFSAATSDSRELHGLVDAALAGSSFMTAGGLNFLVCNVELRWRSLTEPFSCSTGDLKTKLVPVLEPLRWNATRSMTRCLDEVARPMIAHWDQYEHRC